ncbi:hypothetical protein beppo_41 [Salmonella phage beppo]|uniref:Uncharacterized protein n=3 Tax=Viruses TaxID=10239 RepID=A0A6G8RJS8_9CAUD|nr:hypothetical protein HWD28_gp043 [Salmonella phage atrejo]QIO00145.1 hypothetical protein beppo_41 [Salmonella phage beppo]QIO01691.1 hypothetical protein atrejo_43 [Salmonella phage atrejo]
MSDRTLLPTNMGGLGGDGVIPGIAAFSGALIDSWLGNGAGGRGVGVGGVDGAVSVAGTAANMLTTSLVSDIESIQSGLNNLGLTVVQGQGATNLAIANTGAMNLNAITQ